MTPCQALGRPARERLGLALSPARDQAGRALSFRVFADVDELLAVAHEFSHLIELQVTVRGFHQPFSSRRATCAVNRGPSTQLDAVGEESKTATVELLVVEDELANRLRELVALPPAFESSCALALSFRRRCTCRLDRIGGRTDLVRGDVCDGRGLAGSVRGMQDLG